MREVESPAPRNQLRRQRAKSSMDIVPGVPANQMFSPAHTNLYNPYQQPDQMYQQNTGKN